MNLIQSSLDSLKSENSSKQFELENRNITKLFKFFYKIPYYQRPYDWEFEDISKFIEDIFEQTIDYLNTLSDGNNDPKKLKHKFIGTIVISPSRNKPAIKQSGTFFDIVDGQQRITTLQLLLTQLHKILVEYSEILNYDSNEHLGCSNEANQVLHTYKIKLGEVKKAVLKTLYASSDEQPLDALISFMPRITREDKDKWGIQITDSNYQLSYKSGPSLLLFEYLHKNQSLMDIDFTANERKNNIVREYIEGHKNKEFDTVELKTKKIYKFINRLIEDQSNEATNCKIVNSVKLELKEHFEDQKILSTLCRTYILLSFSLYLINKVSTVVVEATNESEAFDIFDSLNTTGEPLNAIQVLNALVVADEITRTSEEQYEISRSKKLMDEINCFVNSIDNLESRNGLILDILKSTKIALTGTGLNGTQLSHQIKFIKDLYNGKYHSSLKDKSPIHLVILEDLLKIVRFYRDVWNGCEIEGNPFECNLNVNYLTANDHTVVIPILSYFYNEYGNSEAIFIEVLDAIVSFSVIWRVLHNGTRGIDNFYKSLFHIDSGLLSSVNILTNKVTASQLKAKLYSQLTKNVTDNIDEELIDSFVRKSKNNDFYDLGKTARYFLLAALEDSIPNHSDEGSYLEETGERNSRLSIFNYETWKNTEIEHIAPKSNENGWDKSIYINPNVINYIGNTTVIPKNENIELSNDSLDNKVRLYELYSTESEKDFNSLLKKLIDEHVLKAKGTVNVRHIRTVSHLVHLKTWNEESIDCMSKALLTLGWKFLIKNLQPNQITYDT